MRGSLKILLLSGLISLFPTLASACNVQSQSRLSIVLNGSLQKDPLQANVGDTLYVKRASLSSLAHQRKDISCASSQSQDQLSITGIMNGSMTGDNVYPTSVAGIGIRLSLLIRQKGNHTPLSTLPVNEQFTLDDKSDLTSDDVFIKTELVKTGSIESLGHISYQSPSILTLTRSALQQSVSVDYSFSATPPAGYCHFLAANAAFSLVPVDVATLQAQKTAASTQFDITYVCTGSPEHIEMTLYGVAADPEKGILKNTLTADNATGVGVQLLYRNLPLAFGSPVSLDDLPMVHNQSSIPLAARYIAISPEVKAGKIDTIATIKLNFL
ncbi:hypothetical protein M2371_003660 [Buttiauxella sp. BIGb0471]|uniref:fimbrial protein n=1 Tax=Buttiauxella sp. BIGb0471 TaxID=2940597 RepID=UPI0021676CAD|nr:fimbrial protein [Buttiauxella sp. BIGb0471]MCS3604420.1 hypothetical protein [Buttiauxella sp. BIGb0471]